MFLRNLLFVQDLDKFVFSQPNLFFIALHVNCVSERECTFMNTSYFLVKVIIQLYTFKVK